jgi:hypothetical protein
MAQRRSGDQPINPAFAKQLIEQGGINERNLRIAAKPKLDMREQIAAAPRRVTTGSTPGMVASRRAGWLGVDAAVP